MRASKKKAIIKMITASFQIDLCNNLLRAQHIFDCGDSSVLVLTVAGNRDFGLRRDTERHYPEF